jgi:uncharacterized iron-regulated protein
MKIEISAKQTQEVILHNVKSQIEICMDKYQDGKKREERAIKALVEDSKKKRTFLQRLYRWFTGDSNKELSEEEAHDILCPDGLCWFNFWQNKAYNWKDYQKLVEQAIQDEAPLILSKNESWLLREQK